MDKLNPDDKLLKRWLAMLRTRPSLLANERIGDPTLLARLLPEHLRRNISADRSVPEQVSSVFRQLVLEFLVNDLNASRYIQGVSWVLIWFTYLDRERLKFAGRMTIAGVVNTFCNEDLLGQFLVNDVKGFVDQSSPENIVLINTLKVVSYDEALRLLMGEMSKGRKTISNYLNSGIQRLVEYIKVTVPELLSDDPGPDESTVKMQPAESADANILNTFLQQTIIDTETLSTAFGYSISTDDYLRRDFETLRIAGDPLAPVIPADGIADFARISGLLVGEAGSGRTSHLIKLARVLVQMYPQTRVLPVYFRAPDFLPFARAQRTLYEFIAAQVLMAAGDGSTGRLKSLDAAGRLFLLGDDLDRLSREEQGLVLPHFALLPNLLLSALPWQVDWIRQQICLPSINRQHFGVFQLAGLSPDQQHDMLSLLARGGEPFDFPLAGLVQEESPWLASLPLGLVAIFHQIRKNASNPAVVGLAFLEEVFRREGTAVKLLAMDELNEFGQALVYAGSAATDAINRSTPPNQISDLSFTEKNILLLPEHENHWKSLSHSRLFIAGVDKKEIRFGSQTLLPLIALASANGQLSFTYSARASDSLLVRQIIALSDAAWEWKCLIRSGLVKL
jgi:hypothetical protein